MVAFEYDKTLDIAVQTQQKRDCIKFTMQNVMSSAKKSLQIIREE